MLKMKPIMLTFGYLVLLTVFLHCAGAAHILSSRQRRDTVCDNNPCKNRAFCLLLNDNKFYCSCLPGFQGTYCELDVNECADPNWCTNGGTCSNTFGSFLCSCRPGTTGLRCDSTPQEICLFQTCRNGATCVQPSSTEFYCVCLPQWTGSLCEIFSSAAGSRASKASCGPDSCGTGTCSIFLGNIVCTCAPEYTGSRCETPTSCTTNPCRNGGACNQKVNSVTCTCPVGFTGQFCTNPSANADQSGGGGCFTTNATVLLESGRRILIQDVSVGDSLLSFDNRGKLVFSKVAMWIDHVPQAKVDIIQITTQTGKTLKATPYHMILVGNVFTRMRDVKIGDELLVTEDGMQLRKEKVESIMELSDGVGVFAPLTYEGTIVVDGVAASCYAYSHRLGEIAFAPMKLMSKLGVASGNADGMHWYSRMLIDWTDTLGMTDWLLN